MLDAVRHAVQTARYTALTTSGSPGRIDLLASSRRARRRTHWPTCAAQYATRWPGWTGCHAVRSGSVPNPPD